MPNQFYIQPGNNFGQGLQSLAGSVERFGQNKRQMEAEERVRQRFEGARTAITSAYQSGNPDQVMEAVLQYPELQDTAKMIFGITNDKTEAIARDTYSRVLSDPDSERALQYLEAGIQQVADAGGNPVNMVQDYAMFKTDPASALKKIQMTAPLFGLGEDSSPRIGTYNPRDYTEDSWAEFTQTKDPSVLERYETSAKERLYTDPNLAGRAVQVESDIAGGKAGAAETAKLSARQAMQPQLEAAIATEVERVKRESAQVQAFDKKASDASGVMDVIELAKPLLDEATESLAGTFVDAAGKLVGLSTDGAEAAAKLKTLEGALILKMPRMEGPQSDRDQMLYRQMAAQIGDSTVPAKIRKAALETLQELNEKYQEEASKETPKTRVKWSDM